MTAALGPGTGTETWGLLAVVLVTGAALAVGAFGMRFARTTSSFLVASRKVPPALNAAAISGEYLSAASFLGIAALVMQFGFTMLWYPVGYTAGYLILLLLVAAPLRRCGAYTIADFAEGRLDSPGVRRVSMAVVVLIGTYYLLPQLSGAGITLAAVAGTPYWFGVVVVGAVIVVNVVIGGMRSVTFSQSFLFWIKLSAIGLPAMLLVAHLSGGALGRLWSTSAPTFSHPTVVHLSSPTRIEVATREPVGVRGKIDGHAVAGRMVLARGRYEVGAGSSLSFRPGEAVPSVVGQPPASGGGWSSPTGYPGEGSGHPLFFVYSVLLATFLGTMGLPHILARFYTNRDGRDAGRTTLTVLALIGGFYLFPPVFGALGRLWDPSLYLTGKTGSVVLLLPRVLFGGIAGDLLGALVAAGAFAAFLSTSSGLLVSIAGALSHDLLARSVRDFRLAALLAGSVAVGLGLLVAPFNINVLVGWAFAIAASSFCPLLVLGIWWRRLTPPGAVAGLLTGGGLASAAVLATMLGVRPGGWPGALLAQPAAWSVPLAFTTMMLVSLLTQGSVPEGVVAKMLVMHAPERLRIAGQRPEHRPPAGDS